MKVTIPAQSEPISIGGGPVNPVWYDKFKYLERLQPLSEIPAVVLPPPLTPGNTTVAVTLGAITDGGNVAPGNIQAYIGYGTPTVLQSLYDSFTTIASQFNKTRTDLLAAQTAEAALNARVTTLENKVNDLISALS